MDGIQRVTAWAQGGIVSLSAEQSAQFQDSTLHDLPRSRVGSQSSIDSLTRRKCSSENSRNDQEHVEQELRWNERCATKMGLGQRRVVELDGHVGSLYEKWAAERAALRSSTSLVASEIIVDLPFESERTDEDIASAAANHLNWNSQVPDTIKLKVSKGWVTLQGTQSGNNQKEEAARAVRFCAW